MEDNSSNSSIKKFNLREATENAKNKCKDKMIRSDPKIPMKTIDDLLRSYDKFMMNIPSTVDDDKMDIFRSINAYFEMFQFNISFSWPNEEIIQRIVDFVGNDTILEIGSGLGLHARLLQEKGVNVIATDDNSWELITNNRKPFTDIHICSNMTALTGFMTEAKAIMFVWPPFTPTKILHADSTSLSFFPGKKLIYIGEERSGATGSDKFHQRIEEEWELVDRIVINPNFSGQCDSLHLYTKKRGTKSALARLLDGTL